jgi:hypothetical protein
VLRGQFGIALSEQDLETALANVEQRGTRVLPIHFLPNEASAGGVRSWPEAAIGGPAGLQREIDRQTEAHRRSFEACEVTLREMRLVSAFVS